MKQGPRNKVDYALISKLLSKGLVRAQIIERTGLPAATISFAIKKLKLTEKNHV